MRIPYNDAVILAQLGIDPAEFAKRLAPAKSVSLTETEIKSIAALDMNGARQEFLERARLAVDDKRVCRSFNDVLTERTEAVAAGAVLKAGEAGLDPFELQLYARGLAVRGESAALIGTMFTEANRALYPEYIRRQMFEQPIGGLNYAMVDDLIAARETETGEIGRGVVITSTTGPKKGRVAERAGLPEVTLSMAAVTVTVQKLGCMFKISYEVARRISLNLLGIFISREGRQFQMDLAMWGANTLLDGASDEGETASSGKLTMREVLGLINHHGDAGFQTGLLLYGPTPRDKILDNAEALDPRINDVIISGRLPNWFGVKNRLVSASSQLGTTKLLSVDTSVAMTLAIEAGSDIAEVDADVTTQTWLYPFSVNLAFWVNLAAAARKLAIKA